MGPEGYVPSLLVFGSMSTFPIPNKDTLGPAKLIKALRTARDDAANIRTEQRIKKAIKHIVLPAAHYKLKTRGAAYTFGEARKKRIAGLRVVDFERKNV